MIMNLLPVGGGDMAGYVILDLLCLVQKLFIFFYPASLYQLVELSDCYCFMEAVPFTPQVALGQMPTSQDHNQTALSCRPLCISCCLYCEFEKKTCVIQNKYI